MGRLVRGRLRLHGAYIRDERAVVCIAGENDFDVTVRAMCCCVSIKPSWCVSLQFCHGTGVRTAQKNRRTMCNVETAQNI